MTVPAIGDLFGRAAPPPDGTSRFPAGPALSAAAGVMALCRLAAADQDPGNPLYGDSSQ